MKENKTYQVYGLVAAGNYEKVILFESTDFDECAKVCEKYLRNPYLASKHARTYLQGWGPGVDDFGIVEKK